MKEAVACLSFQILLVHTMNRLQAKLGTGFTFPAFQVPSVILQFATG